LFGIIQTQIHASNTNWSDLHQEFKFASQLGSYDVTCHAIFVNICRVNITVSYQARSTYADNYIYNSHEKQTPSFWYVEYRFAFVLITQLMTQTTEAVLQRKCGYMTSNPADTRTKP
jgi:hypothetical protein